VSSFTDVKRGFVDGFRMSASSLVISASMSTSSPLLGTLSTATLLVCSGWYSFIAYYDSVSFELPSNPRLTETAIAQVNTNLLE
jgi:hypothetical protein